MKRITITFLCICIASQTFSMGTKEGIQEQPSSIHIAALRGPSALGMSRLFETGYSINTIALTMQIASSIDAVYPKLLNGDIDIAILPPNVAAKLYNKNPSSIVVLAVVGNSMLSLLSRDPTIQSPTDLSGKKVYVAGQGATPDYILRTLTTESLSDVSKVQYDYSLSTADIATAIATGRIDYAFLPEPFVTLSMEVAKEKNNPLTISFSAQDSWAASGKGDDFPMTVCVVRKEFAKQHDSLVRDFLEAYRLSVQWTLDNPKRAGTLAEKAGIGLQAAVAEKAIPRCNLVFIPANEARGSLERLLQVFLLFDSQSIGGRLPDDGFYFQ